MMSATFDTDTQNAADRPAACVAQRARRQAEEVCRWLSSAQDGLTTPPRRRAALQAFARQHRDQMETALERIREVETRLDELSAALPGNAGLDERLARERQKQEALQTLLALWMAVESRQDEIRAMVAGEVFGNAPAGDDDGCRPS